MPDINTWSDGPGSHPPPGQPPQAHSSAVPGDMSMANGGALGAAGGCVRHDIPGGEERMQMVFDERAVAENSDEHMAAVAERCEAPHHMPPVWRLRGAEQP
jgi:hypothetical protein